MQVRLDRNIEDLRLRDGDILHVDSTLGRRLFPCSQIVFEGANVNINQVHYIKPPVEDVLSYVPPKRVTITFADSFGMEMALTTRDNARLGDMMEAFAKLTGKDMRSIDFRFKDKELEAQKTLREVRPPFQT